MRRQQWLLTSLAAAFLLIGTGCGMSSMQHGSPTTKTDQSFDIQFIDMMVPHHQGAIEMAKIAEQRAEHPELTQMADAIVSAQEGEISQMKAWRLEWFGSDQTPPLERMPMVPGMGGHGSHGTMNMAADVDALRNAPEPFDKAFIDAMIPHHQSAVKMAQHALKQAKRPEIKQLAQEIISSQEQEITQMKQWQTAWYGS